MFTTIIERIVLVLIAIGVIVIVSLFVAAYFFSLLVAISIISGIYYAYPHVHNGGVILTEKVADQVGIPQDEDGLLFILFCLGLWNGFVLFPVALVEVLLESTLIHLPITSLATAGLSVTLLLATPFGLGIGLVPRPVAPVSRGLVGKAVSIIRDRFDLP